MAWDDGGCVDLVIVKTYTRSRITTEKLIFTKDVTKREREKESWTDLAVVNGQHESCCSVCLEKHILPLY